MSVLEKLADVIEQRRASSSSKSYVKSLLENPENAADKVLEETKELVQATQQESKDRVANEAADLVFHLLVLAATRGVDWSNIEQVLQDRFGISGHDEKAARTRLE